MKFLTICLGGNVRSAGLAFILKDTYGQDAVPVGAIRNAPDTIAMLGEWADYIVVMAQEVVPHLPPAILRSPKLCMVDVGPDVYGSPFHPQLQGALAPIVKDWAARGWNLLGGRHAVD